MSVSVWLCSAALPSGVLADSDTPIGSAFRETNVPADAIFISADFEGAVDPSLSTAYFCKGVAEFIAAPTKDRQDNKALLLTLDPRKSGAGRCDPQNAPTERAELVEPDDLRLPQGTEVWYGFRFMIPRAMKGKFVDQRLVIAQLKQHPEPCALFSKPLGVSAAGERNPTVSLRVIEDPVGDVMGLQLAVSSDDVRKIALGQLMRHRQRFLDRWHEVVLHLKVVPHGSRSEHSRFVEGWLDGHAFNTGLYGMLDGSDRPDTKEPFGYSDLFGCTYLKFGIYRDRQEEPWAIAFDHFRRGTSRLSVEAAAD